MRFIVGFVTIATLFSSLAFGNVTADQEYILNSSGSAAQKVQLGTLVNRTSNLLIAKYSFAIQGGSTAADISLLTNLANSKSLAKLPNKAIIKNVYLEVLTQPVSGGSATVALNSLAAADLLAATAKAALPVGFKQGIPTGATTTFIKLTSEKTIKATVGTSPLTAGKFNVYIDYVVGD